VWNDLRVVEQFGPFLDQMEDKQTVRDLLIRKILKIRVKKGGIRYLKLNQAQQEYSRRCSKRNIVLKARQVGITTYIAARYFIQTITRPGTLTVQVAHSEESAQAIFNIVHRFWEKLPNDRVHRGALLKSRSNIRQIVFPKLDSEYRVETADDNAGRGMTIHNLHCSEVSRWPGGGEETLASLRAAVVPDARNSARLDSEIEATKARVMRLEQIAATNTEGRIRTEVQLGELRDGQAEIKAMIQAHDRAGKRVATQ
jgi:hypothetical protein